MKTESKVCLTNFRGKNRFNLLSSKGLWRGWTGILVRTAVGSSAQLSTFSKSKDLLVEYEFFADSIFFTAVGASMVSGLSTAVAMTPFDTVATRMFNQGKRLR